MTAIARSDSFYMKAASYIPVLGSFPRAAVWILMRKEPDSPQKTHLTNEYLVADVARSMLSIALAVGALALEILTLEAFVASFVYYAGAAIYCYISIDRDGASGCIQVL